MVEENREKERKNMVCKKERAWYERREPFKREASLLEERQRVTILPPIVSRTLRWTR